MGASKILEIACKGVRVGNFLQLTKNGILLHSIMKTTTQNVMTLAKGTMIPRVVTRRVSLLISLKPYRNGYSKTNKFSNSELRYVPEVLSNHSLSVEDLYGIYRDIQKELYRAGRLSDHQVATRRWYRENRERAKYLRKRWQINNRDKVNEYARKHRAKKKQEKAIIEKKLRLVNDELSNSQSYEMQPTVLSDVAMQSVVVPENSTSL